MIKEKIEFISILSDTTIKYLWKNPITKNWFNEIILDKTGVDLSNYILVDNEFNTGSKVKDFKTDLIFSDGKNSLISEMNREYSISGEIKGRRYLFRKAGSSFNTGETYKDDRTTVLVMLNNYKKHGFEECKMVTYSLFSKEIEHSYNDLKICEIYLPVYHEKSYNNLSKVDKKLWLFTCNSFEEMYKVADDEDSLYIIQELERLSMNDKFRDEYDAELVNRTLMESLKDEGYNNGFSDGFNDGNSKGKQQRNIEIAKKMLEKEIETNFIIECTGLSFEEVESIRKNC